jgi:hypothetical protein
MLQTLASFAAERLAARGHAAVTETHRRHAAWVAGLVRAAERGAGTRPTVSLGDLDAEVENIDAALAWAQTADPELAFDLAARLGWFWFWTGRIEHGWIVLSGTLAQGAAAPAAVRARAFAFAGLLGAVMRADHAADLVETAVVEGQASRHPSSLAQAQVIRAALAVLRGDAALAGSDLDAAAAGHAQSGDRHGQGMVEMVRGLAAVAQGNAPEARASYERSVDFLVAAGDDWAAGVARHRIAQLDETVAGVTADAVPAHVAAAMVRAQLASAHDATREATSHPAAGSPAEALALAVADHIRGRVVLRSDRPADARPVLELALRRYQAQGNAAAVSTCLGDLGRLATAVGDVAGAVRLHAGATEAALGAGDQAAVLASLEGLSAALVTAGDPRRAALVLGAADALRDAGVEPWDPSLDDRACAEAAAGGDTEMRHAGRTLDVDGLLQDLTAA